MVRTCTLNNVAMSLPPPKSHKCSDLTRILKTTKDAITYESKLSLVQKETDIDISTFQ